MFLAKPVLLHIMAIGMTLVTSGKLIKDILSEVLPLNLVATTQLIHYIWVKFGERRELFPELCVIKVAHSQDSGGG